MSPGAAPTVEGRWGERVELVAPWEGRARVEAWVRDGLLAVTVEPPPPAKRGHLAEVLDDAIETALEGAHAGAPGLGASRERGTLLADQLFRARRVGRRGVALLLGTLAGIAEQGALATEDAAALTTLLEATTTRPIHVALAKDDAHASRPLPLADLFEVAPPTEPTVVDAPVDVMPVEARPIERSRNEASPIEAMPRETAVTQETLTPFAPVVAPAKIVDVPLVRPIAPTPPPAPRPVAPAVDETWRTWAHALGTARGPQPLAAFEKTFTQSYVPLASRLAAGLDDPRAHKAAQEFRHAFSRAYAEAFPTFAWTGKRPRMVLDAPQIAMRVARPLGARVTQLLLVDAMRWDVGLSAFAEMERALAGRAVVAAAPSVLYAALPTTTPRQIETLARGETALRDVPEQEPEDPPARRRGTEAFRRMRIAGRAYDKLDRVEAHLREAGARAKGELDELGRSTGAVLGEYVSTLPPRTLAFVFGDHGFTFAPHGAPEQGGTSPEEVLVPCFAFYVPELH